MIDHNSLPTDPGCYLYKNAKGKIIYVGKAKNLKKRVSSYFTKSISDAKTLALVADIRDVDFFVTRNEVEALVLENNLIKKHRPYYNINLKDSKRYAHIVITKEKFPRLLQTRRQNIKGKYFGPFISGEKRVKIARTLQQAFQIRTCRTLPKKECLRYHIGLCSAPCIGAISEEDYAKDIKRAEEYLSGNTKALVESIRSDMQAAAKDHNFERAKSLRDQLFALERLQDQQHVELQTRFNAHIINFISKNDEVSLMVFKIENGVLSMKDEYSFDKTPNFFEEFIVQYYSDHELPREVILPESLYDKSIADYLQQLRNGAVTVLVPQRGLKKRLLDLVRRNLVTKFVDDQHGLTALRDVLRMQQTPVVIECFDISHLSGTNIVASMVQFRAGKPDKSNYRHFKLKTVLDNDDFASMNEVVGRRYKRLVEEGKPLPDLVVIDGGKGQLSAAMKALSDIGLKIPMISLAKREEEIFVPGRSTPIKLKRSHAGLKILIHARNEAHRFAVTFQRKQRSMKLRDEFKESIQD